MLLIASALGLIAIASICALLLRLSVHALPLLVAYVSGVTAFDAGAGLLASIAIGAIAAITLLAVAQLALAHARSDLGRGVVAMAFAAPASCAGYFAARGIAEVAVASTTLQFLVSLIGAAIIGGASWMQWSRDRL